MSEVHLTKRSLEKQKIYWEGKTHELLSKNYELKQEITTLRQRREELEAAMARSEAAAAAMRQSIRFCSGSCREPDSDTGRGWMSPDQAKAMREAGEKMHECTKHLYAICRHKSISPPMGDGVQQKFEDEAEDALAAWERVSKGE